MNTIYKIRDTATGLFYNTYQWNYKTQKRNMTFSNTGKTFKTKKNVLTFISNYSEYLPITLEVVEYKITYTEQKIDDVSEKIEEYKLKSKIVESIKTGDTYSDNHKKSIVGNLIDKLITRNELKTTSHILVLKKDDDASYWSNIPQSKILEARAVLRGLGVKTRSFREYYGAFAMFNNDQSLKAKLLLDISLFLDIDSYR